MSDDGFADMIETANRIFAKLKAENTKEVFEPLKGDWTARVKKPAEHFAEEMSGEIARLTGKPHKPKVFRVYRDVRFSKDKTPLNTHLHILWAPEGGGEADPAIFFGSDLDGIFVCSGLMGLKGPALADLRARIGRDGGAILAAASEAGAELSSYGPEPLKRVPKPYDDGHPHAEMLKRKSFVWVVPVKDWRGPGLFAATRAAVERLLPLHRLMGG